MKRPSTHRIQALLPGVRAAAVLLLIALMCGCAGPTGPIRRPAGLTLRNPVRVFPGGPQITTVLIVRHAEKLNPNSTLQTEPLSKAGKTRAGQLRDTLLSAGVGAVYSTDTVRTIATVKPVADARNLGPPQIYTDPATLSRDVLAQYRGGVILVAAHGPSVAAVANAFGAPFLHQVPFDTISDFDNLYVVTLTDTDSNVVNLQYAADSQPDLTKNDRHAMTLLLVGTPVVSSAQEQRNLLHAARKASVSAIYTSTANNPLLTRLATGLNLTPTNFNGNDMPAFASHLLSTHAQETVVIAGTDDELRRLIARVGGYLILPRLPASVGDRLIVMTRFPSGVQTPS